MEDLDLILKTANDLGHLLAANEIVKRYTDLSRKLEATDSSRELLEDYLEAAQAAQHQEAAGETLSDEDRTRIEELEKKVREDSLIREFLATQNYYMHLMTQVNQAIARPTGEPPRRSNIIVPGQGSGIVVP